MKDFYILAYPTLFSAIFTRSGYFRRTGRGVRRPRALRQEVVDRSPTEHRGARWLSGRVSDSGARGRGFETYRRRVVSLSKALYSPKVLVNYPGSVGSVPT